MVNPVLLHSWLPCCKASLSWLHAKLHSISCQLAGRTFAWNRKLWSPPTRQCASLSINYIRRVNLWTDSYWVNRRQVKNTELSMGFCQPANPGTRVLAVVKISRRKRRAYGNWGALCLCYLCRPVVHMTNALLLAGLALLCLSVLLGKSSVAQSAGTAMTVARSWWGGAPRFWSGLLHNNNKLYPRAFSSSSTCREEERKGRNVFNPSIEFIWHPYRQHQYMKPGKKYIRYVLM